MRREKIMQTIFFGIVMVVVVTMAFIFHGKESDPSTTTGTQTEATSNVTKTTEETTEKTTEEMTEAPHDTSDWENQDTGEPSTTETPGVQ